MEGPRVDERSWRPSRVVYVTCPYRDRDAVPVEAAQTGVRRPLWQPQPQEESMVQRFCGGLESGEARPSCIFGFYPSDLCEVAAGSVGGRRRDSNAPFLQRKGACGHSWCCSRGADGEHGERIESCGVAGRHEWCGSDRGALGSFLSGACAGERAVRG